MEASEDLVKAIEAEVGPRLCAMISHEYDAQDQHKAICGDSQQRIWYSLGWSRLLMGRLLLEFLGIQEAKLGRAIDTNALHLKNYEELPGHFRRDLRVTDANGLQISRKVVGVDEWEWEILLSFRDIAGRMIHLTWSCENDRSLNMIDWSKHEHTEIVNQAIPLIVLAMKRCFYDPVMKKIPVPDEYLRKYGIS